MLSSGGGAMLIMAGSGRRSGSGIIGSGAIDSGSFKGTVLQPNPAGVYTYPYDVRPMPSSHDLKIAIAGGQPGDLVTLAFAGDRTFDQNSPIAGAVGLAPEHAVDLLAQGDDQGALTEKLRERRGHGVILLVSSPFARGQDA